MAVATQRGDNWVRVSHLGARVAAHLGLSSVGHICSFTIDLCGSDEVTFHEGDLEVYVSLERLSELHETLDAFLKEAKLALEAGYEQT